MARTQISSEIVVLIVGQHGTLKSLLRNEGFCVLTASTGEEALALSRQFTDQMALITYMDIGPINGIELYSQIRKQRPQTQALFIANEANRVRESLPGIQVLEEPFRTADFFDKWRAVLLRNDSLPN